MQYEVHNILPYGDNRKIVKFEYRSPAINNECKIEFNNYELKKDADVRAMSNIFFRFETKDSIEVEARISISVEDIVKILKRLPDY